MNVRQLRIGARLAWGFGLVLGLLIAALGGAIVAESQLRSTLQQQLGTASAKERASGEMRAALFEAAVAMRNVVLESEVAAFQKQADRARAMDKRYAQARDAFAALQPTADEKALLARIAELEAKVAKPFSQAVQLASALDGEQAVKVIAGQVEPVQQQQIALINELQALQIKSYEAAVARGEQRAQLSTTVLVGVALAVVAVAALFAWLCTRSITLPLAQAVQAAQRVAAGDLSAQVAVAGKDEAAQLLRALDEMTRQLRHMVSRVRDGSDSIATGSGEIATGNDDLSRRTEQQASSLQQTAASMESLTEVVRHNTDHARQASRMASHAAGVASEGGNLVSQVVATMQEISQSSQRIADITAVIDGIAFQTNILALNAAVEAARAGEQGRGFAVVAAEVRALAQRSAAAARDIKQLIDASAVAVARGGGLVEQAGSTMTGIVAEVQNVSQLIGDISGSTEHQATAIDEVRAAVSQLDGVTQQNAALVEQSAAAAENLRLQAVALARLVTTFKLDGGPAAAVA